MADEITGPDGLRRILTVARTVVVLGAHPRPERPAHYVPRYLAEQGYRVIPVNPRFAGQVLFGEPVLARLEDVPVRADLLNVFRRSEDLPAHLPQILAMRHRPAVVWLQAGIVNDVFARDLIDAGIDVVQDECTYALHRRFAVPRVPPAGHGDVTSA